MNRWLLAQVAVLGCALPSFAQFVNFDAPGSSSIIFDDSLQVTGGTVAWTNGATAPGVYAFKTNSPGPVTSYVTSNGSSGSDSLYSYGSAGSSDRALGAIAGNTLGNFAYGVIVHNTSGGSLTVSLAYTGEQWRNSGDAAAQTLQFNYQAFDSAPTSTAAWGAGSATPGGYTNIPSLNFTSPVTGGAGGALDGNAAANRQVFADTTVTSLNDGQYLVLRWFDGNDAGNDHGLAIDDITITATPVPEPAAVLGLAGVGLGLVRLTRRRR